MHIYNKLVIIIGFGIFKFTSMADMGNFFKNRLASSGEGVQSAVMICGTAVAIALLFIDTALIVKALGSNVPFLYAKNF